MQKINCSIYKTPQREGVYLYLPQSTPIEELPELLQQLFAERVEVLTLTLTPTTQLAVEDPLQVLANLREDGYHLQLQAQTGTDLLAALQNQFARQEWHSKG